MRNAVCFQKLTWVVLASLFLPLPLSVDTATGEEQLVGPFGAPTAMEFDGCKLLTDDAVLMGLYADLEYQLASRPSASRARFATLIADKLRLGLQHNGFMHGDVAVEFDESRQKTLVHVKEGPRFVCGEVEVIADKSFPAAKVQRWLTESDSESNLAGYWETGKPVAFDQVPVINALAKRACAEAGYFYTKLATTMQPDTSTGRTTLKIEVIDSGPRGLIGDIHVVGCERNTPEDVIAYLELAPGQLIDQQRLRDLQAKLVRSGRFWQAEVEALVEINHRVPLEITLVEHETLPTLREGLSRNQQTLVHASDWWSGFNENDEDFVMEAEAPVNDQPVRISAVISPKDGILMECRLPDSRLQYVVLVQSDKALVYLIGARQIVEIQDINRRLVLSAGLTPCVRNDGRWGASFKLGAEILDGKRSPGVEVKFSADPIVMLYSFKSHLGEVEDGVLTIRDTEQGIVGKFDVDSGRPIEVSATESDARVAFERGAFQKRLQQLQVETSGFPRHTAGEDFWLSLFAIGMTEYAALYGQDERRTFSTHTLEIFERLLSIPSSSNPKPKTLKEDPGKEEKEEVEAISFAIPATGRRWSKEYKELIVAALLLNDGMFPRGSWPWTLTRETIFENQTGEVAFSEFMRLVKSDMGPLGGWAMAKTLDHMNNTTAMAVANQTRFRLNKEDLRKDVDLLIDNENVFPKLVGALQRNLQQLSDDDVQHLLKTAPQAWLPTIQAADKYVRRSELPGDEAIHRAAREAWDLGLKGWIYNELEAIKNTYEEYEETEY